jgi:arylformamidase
MRRHGRGAVACGHSAGGHLTAMLLATDWPAYGLPSNAVASGTAFSGLFDLAPLLATTVNDKLGLDVAEAACLSPIRLPAPVARLTALVGGLEGAEYVRQSREIAQHWAGAWAVLPGRHHFDIVAPLADPAAPMVAALAENARAAAA